MYYKGGNMLHTIRQLDRQRRRSGAASCAGSTRRSGTRPSPARRSQDYISTQAGVDLSKVFEQYLTTTKIPVLEYHLEGTALTYRWADVVPGFAMPVDVVVGPERRDAAHAHRAMADDDAGARATRRLPGGRELLRRHPLGGAAEAGVAGHGRGPMIGPAELARLQPLIAAAGVDGWLLFDFRGRNPIAAAVLGGEIVGSRRVYVLIPPAGPPHGAGACAWTPSSGAAGPPSGPSGCGSSATSSRPSSGALVRGKRLAVDYSPNGAIPYIDGVPAGVLELLRGLGADAGDVGRAGDALLLRVDAGTSPPTGAPRRRSRRSRARGWRSPAPRRLAARR